MRRQDFWSGRLGMERCGSVARSSLSVSAAYKQIRKYYPKLMSLQPQVNSWFVALPEKFRLVPVACHDSKLKS
jgi:hypothetical protein